MSLVDTPSTALYTPSGVQIFGIIDPDALNTSFAGVASAFNLTTSVVTGDTQLSAMVRNVEVYNSGSTPIVVTLPPSPAIGDPPCIVSAQYIYHASFGANAVNATITTSDGNPINGITPNAGNTNTPALYNSGDNLQFVFVGGSVGWLANGKLLSVVDTFGYVPPVKGAFPWQGQSLFLTVNQQFPLSVEPLQVVGARAAVCRIAGGSTISMGDATSTFNGVAGPYVISTSNILYKFTCLGGRAFMVTV